MRKISPRLRRVPNGKNSYPGQWPWFVALYENGSDKFLCGATLINQWTLVTSKCLKFIRNFQKKKIISAASFVNGLQPKDIDALIGKFDLFDEAEKHWLRKNISEIKIHENSGGYPRPLADSNIAILIFEEPLKFTNFIQPICLPTKGKSSYNIEGTIVGYGSISPNSLIQSTLNYEKSHSISPKECLKTHRYAPVIVSRENSFCVRSETSVSCQGENLFTFNKF